jgi:hypothetical protein
LPNARGGRRQRQARAGFTPAVLSCAAGGGGAAPPTPRDSPWPVPFWPLFLRRKPHADQTYASASAPAPAPAAWLPANRRFDAPQPRPPPPPSPAQRTGAPRRARSAPEIGAKAPRVIRPRSCSRGIGAANGGQPVAFKRHERAAVAHAWKCTHARANTRKIERLRGQLGIVQFYFTVARHVDTTPNI